MTKRQAYSITGMGVLLGGLVAGVILAQQPQVLTRKAAEQIQNQLNCNPGPNPYHSTSITVTNNTTKTIDKIEADVFRCPYKPGHIDKYLGSVKCEDVCDAVETSYGCLQGYWDGDVSQPWRNIVMQPGESRTFTMTVNPCEIAQLDVRNNIENPSDEKECVNVESQHTVDIGDEWPGGIAFAIEENPTGYNATTGTCPAPTTPPPTPTSPPLPTATPTPVVVIPTATPQPTAPPGQPTYTPIPTVPYCQPPNVCIPSSQCTGAGRVIASGSCAHVGTGYVCCTTPMTPAPTRPVAGAYEVTVVGILGGIALLILAAL